MTVRTAAALAGTEREATGRGWTSLRLLLESDGLPFSVHQTTVDAGTELFLEYRNHSETVYCISGKASLEIIASRETQPVGPGTLYCARIGDRHVLRTDHETRFLCIFNPPLKGREEAD